MTLIYAMVLGALCIDDCDILRSGRLAALSGSRGGTFPLRRGDQETARRPPHAPSSLGRVETTRAILD
jgi:hypothetical protein